MSIDLFSPIRPPHVALAILVGLAVYSIAVRVMQ